MPHGQPIAFYPHTAPPLGVCLPVRAHSVRDGDTVVVLLGERQLAVRLKDCWAPERNRPGGHDATMFVHDVLTKADEGDLRLWIPLGGEIKDWDAFNIISFDRLVAHVFVGSQTLSEMVVKRGLASSVKGGELGR